MKYVWAGFHIFMLAMVVLTFAGVFSPPKTGNFAQDNGGYILPLIGWLAIWFVGAIILRFVRKFSKY